MKDKGTTQGLPEQEPECGTCGTRYGVRWIGIASSHYTFSGYVCEHCEPQLDPVSGQVIS